MADLDWWAAQMFTDGGSITLTRSARPDVYGYIEQTPEGWYWVHELHHADGRIERFREYADGLYEDNP